MTFAPEARHRLVAKSGWEQSEARAPQMSQGEQSLAERRGVASVETAHCPQYVDAFSPTTNSSPVTGGRRADSPTPKLS